MTWIRDEVATFDPDANKLLTKGGKEVEYDYLVVATGMQYHYEKIEGLNTGLIGQHGISSVYLSDLAKGTAEGGTITRDWFNAVREAAKTSKPRVIFTQPSTPIKCGGAPQKMLYLCDDYLKRDKLDAEFIFARRRKLFSIEEIEAMSSVQKRYGNITNKFSHELIRTTRSGDLPAQMYRGNTTKSMKSTNDDKEEKQRRIFYPPHLPRRSRGRRFDA